MSRFGSRVIGKAAAEKEALVKKHHARKYGSRVIGDVLARKHEIKAQGNETADAEKKMEKRRGAAAEAEAKRAAVKEPAKEPVVEKVEAPITANIDELQEALASNPAFFNDLFAAEKARAEGPRKQALRLFLSHVLEHGGEDGLEEEIQGLLQA